MRPGRVGSDGFVMRQPLLRLAILVLLVVCSVGVVPAAASGRARVSMRAPARARVGALVVFAGHAGSGAGSTVSVERRIGRGWGMVVSGRSGRAGRFSLTWEAPPRAGRVVVRAVSPRSRLSASASQVIHVLPLAKGRKPTLASARTRVLSPSVVSSAPPPGRSGTLVYSGGNDVLPGQIVAINAGPATPDGFLGRVTSVKVVGAQTVISTIPTTLLEAVPNGSLDASASSVSASAARYSPRAHAAATVTCQGSAGGQISRSVSFSAGITLKGSWSLLHGLQSASLRANASADASLKAMLAAAGSCSLAKTAVLSFPGPSVDTFVGPVPVVMTSRITVYVDASASVSASTTTSATAGISASAGIGWTKSSGYYPIQSFDPKFTSSPPSVSANANVGMNLTPTVDVLLYGVLGPQIALRTGLAFNADIHNNPWWTLAAPVDLTASIAIPTLKLTSPTLHIYKHTFPVANAGGPLGSDTGSGGGQPASAAARTVRIDWDTDQTDMDLHIWDPNGNEAWYQHQDGIASGQLSADITNGFGPENFSTTDSSTPLAIGVCYFASNTGDGSQPPTDVTVTITEADGSQRVDHVTLNQPGDEQVVDSSPAGGAVFVPDPGWCQDDNGGTSP
jgi:hypothetical protein